MRLLATPRYGWDLTMTRGQNANKLVHKSPTFSTQGPYGTQFQEGYPLFGYWGNTVESYADRNGDGILAPNEVTFGPRAFMGAPYPKSEMTYANSVSLFNGALRVNANFDQINGLSNHFNVGLTRGAVDRTAPFGEQAGWIQAYMNNGYLGETSSLRFNELSVTYTVPTWLLRHAHAKSLAVTMAGRNLALWTSYVGKDPNVDTSGQLGEVADDDGTGVPQPRNWLLRFNLGL